MLEFMNITALETFFTQIVPTHIPGCIHLIDFDLDLLLQDKKEIIEIRLWEVLGKVFRNMKEWNLTIFI